MNEKIVCEICEELKFWILESTQNKDLENNAYIQSKKGICEDCKNAIKWAKNKMKEDL